MISADLRKQALIFLICSASIIAALVFLRFIEPNIVSSINSFFDSNEEIITKTTDLLTPDSNSPTENTNTANNGQNNRGNANGSQNSAPQPDNSNVARANKNQANADPLVSAEKQTEKKKRSEAVMGAALAISVVTNFFLILKIILWFGLVVVFVRFLNSLIFGLALKNATNYEISGLIGNIVNILIYIVSFFIIFKTQYPTIDLGAIFTTSTIIGVVIGLALQDTLGNLFAGFAIQADQPFQIGDVVTIQNRGTGVVETISWRGLKIRTFQNKLMIISNSVLGKEVIEVAPRDNLNARLVFFNTLYVHSPAKTIEAIRAVVRQVENVSNKIRPVVRIRNLGADGLDWEVKYWLEDYSKYNTTDALIRQNIWYAFQREKVDFAYPTRTVYLQESAQPVAFMEDADEKFERLANVPIFSPLCKEEIEALSKASSVRVFAPNEPIVRQGQHGNSMFVIHRGSVIIQVKEEGVIKNIGVLNQEDFFGEMALFTGQDRTASVIAEVETEVLEIKHTSLKPILENNPELVQSFGDIIDERRSELDKQQTETATRKKRANTGLVNSIRKFFGLKA